VQGSARNPRVQLYSEPTVPDNEKLSWLLFGHGTENMERSDSAILLQGLSALLSDDNGGPSLSERVLDTVGIEEVELKTVKSTDSKPTQVMTVSKRIGQNWQFSIEKSLNGLNDAVKLAYQLSRRWSLVSRWGTDESSIEATHTLRFD
jgi:translocation and assembly module TamB